jgi:transaldolase
VNRTIFAAAISGLDSYDDQVHAMALRKVNVEAALRTITAPTSAQIAPKARSR